MDMKLIIFAAVLSVGFAKDFSVTDASGKTCAMLSLEGTMDLTARENDKPIGEKELNIADATLLVNSSCELIKLDWGDSAELWFQFDTKDNNWVVTPKTTFVPVEVFGSDVNDTTAQVMTADSLTAFPKTDSYKCVSSTTFTFSGQVTSEYIYSATAAVTNFQIQSVDSESFVSANECAADTTPTQYLCVDGNSTVIVMEGNLTLAITYNKTDKGSVVSVTETVTVPAPEQTTTEGSICNPSASTETLIINFFDDWSLQFGFAMDGSDYYYVSNITVNYQYDSHLPNATSSGSQTVQLDVPDSYEKASTSGYYVCNAEIQLTTGAVTFSTENFKYRAFDAKSDGLQGDVSQCSADEESNSIVPIAVGAALAGLVVIVLIAYLIGRKRSRKTGYESV